MALNIKQEKFIQNIVNGMSQRQAYKDAYNAKYSEKSIDEKASTLFNSEKVQERYKELLKKLEDESIMSAKERRQWLTKVIKGDIKHTSYDGNGNSYENEAYISDKMKAMDILNKMDGEYTTNIKGNLSLTYEEALKKVSETDEY
jgi:phage terminase small subunit